MAEYFIGLGTERGEGGGRTGNEKVLQLQLLNFPGEELVVRKRRELDTLVFTTLCHPIKFQRSCDKLYSSG